METSKSPEIAKSGTSSRNTTTNEPPKRLKKWAPKVRTGCKTCRAHRIKCDETKPVCKKCLTYGRSCSGEGYSKQDGAMPVVAILREKKFVKSEPRDDHQERPGSPPYVWIQLWRGKAETAAVVPELLPVEWHFLECIAFYNTVVLEFVQTSQAIPSGFNEPYSARAAEPMMDTIVAFTLAVRIATVSRVYGNRLQPSEAYNTAHLWSHLYRRVENTLQKINYDIKNRPFTAIPAILQNIHGIKGVELMLQSPGWRPHMEGFLALLKFYGGPKVVLNRYGIGHAPNDCVVESVIANTVAPPNDQILGVSDFSNEDIIFLYSHMSHPSLPCPTHLFEEILKINDLRVGMYYGTLSQTEVCLRADEIFAGIDEFVPSKWTESYLLPDIPEVPLLAHIFQVAVGLFGRLVLPVGDSASGHKDKIKRRDSLLQLISKAFESENCQSALNWPLAVVGYALAGGSPNDQALVSRYLVEAAIEPNSTQPLVIKAKLQRFWASGMTEWDDCWREPFVVIG